MTPQQYKICAFCISKVASLLFGFLCARHSYIQGAFSKDTAHLYIAMNASVYVFMLLGVVGASIASPAATSEFTKEEATAEGVKYFADRCITQRRLLVALEDALSGGDFDAIKAAYIASRPPYEEIELLAPAEKIGPLDGAIDWRPYALDGGEDNPEWQGFHRVERDLYRDDNITAATKSLKQLQGKVDELCTILSAAESSVTPQNNLDGQLALAYELPAKKLSSEEETWSDSTLMIYRHNIIGVYSQFAPFKKVRGLDQALAAKVDGQYENVKAVYNKIDPNGFGAKDGKSRKYSSVGEGERKELTEAAYNFAGAIKSVHDALSENGEDTAAEEDAESVVIGSPEKFRDETAGGIFALGALCKKQQETLAALTAAVMSGDMRTAQIRYTPARMPYEQIEVVASAFEEQDKTIDARPDAYEFGERSDDWTGMHQVERLLFRDYDLESTKRPLAKVKDAVETLCQKLENGRLYEADTAFKGMISLATEVPAKKISSEEEAVSDLSVMIFRENCKGVKAIFDPFRPLLSDDARQGVDYAFWSIKNYWETEVDPENDWNNGVDFAKYSTIGIAKRRGIHNRFYSLRRALLVAQAEVAAVAEA